MAKQLPGFEVGTTRTPREILLSNEGLITVPGVVDGSKGIDGGNSISSNEIRAGWFMGLITASNKWVPCKRTKTDGGATSADVTVDDASAFRAGDTISVGGDTGLTVDSVNYSTNTITLTGSITFVDDEDVVAEDGSEDARGILLDWVKLRDTRNENDADKGSRILVAGGVLASMVLGDAAEIRASDTNGYLDNIVFSDEHGLS